MQIIRVLLVILSGAVLLKAQAPSMPSDRNDHPENRGPGIFQLCSEGRSAQPAGAAVKFQMRSLSAPEIAMSAHGGFGNLSSKIAEPVPRADIANAAASAGALFPAPGPAVERRMRTKGTVSEWRLLAMVSTISVILWLTTLFVGTLLTVAV